MKKLEINQLKYYLGTSLKVSRIHTLHCGIGIGSLDHVLDSELYQYRPQMFPLSALTEPVLDGGKVPIVELAKMFHKDDEYDITSYENPEKFINEYRVECHIMKSKYRYMYYSIPSNYEKMQYRVIEQLFQWHFWPFDQSLFETGELIDKRTVKQ